MGSFDPQRHAPEPYRDGVPDESAATATAPHAARLRLGHQIRATRRALGLTQVEVAARSGLHPKYVGSVERGERNIGFDNLMALATALEVPLAKLFDEV